MAIIAKSSEGKEEEFHEELWKLPNLYRNVVSRGYKEQQGSLLFNGTTTTTFTVSENER